MVPFLRAQGVGAIITLFGKSIELPPPWNSDSSISSLKLPVSVLYRISSLFSRSSILRSSGVAEFWRIVLPASVALEPFWLGGLFVKTPSCRRRLPWRGAVMHIFPSMRGFAFRSIRLRRKFSVASIENARS